MKKLLLACVMAVSACALPIVERVPRGYGDFVLRIPETEALVGVDEGFAGKVGDFNSRQHALRLPAGPHTIIVVHPSKGRCVMPVYAVSGKSAELTCEK